MPALAVTFDRAILDELWHHPVQVVRLDLQSLGDLGDGDPGWARTSSSACVARVLPPRRSGAAGRADGGRDGEKRWPRPSRADGPDRGGCQPARSRAAFSLVTSCWSSAKRLSMSLTVLSTKSAN